MTMPFPNAISRERERDRDGERWGLVWDGGSRREGEGIFMGGRREDVGAPKKQAWSGE